MRSMFSRVLVRRRSSRDVPFSNTGKGYSPRPTCARANGANEGDSSKASRLCPFFSRLNFLPPRYATVDPTPPSHRAIEADLSVRRPEKSEGAPGAVLGLRRPWSSLQGAFDSRRDRTGLAKAPVVFRRNPLP